MYFFKNGTGWCVRHDPNAKPQIIRKSQAPIFRKLQAASLKQAIQETVPQCDIEEATSSEASSSKPQAPSSKLQASSRKLQAP
jgi:hypothetical protein